MKKFKKKNTDNQKLKNKIKKRLQKEDGSKEITHYSDNKIENTTYDSMSSLSHTKWNCKYHIVFTPKYRRKIFYGQKRLEIGKILRDLCEWNEVKIIEAEVCPDHVHMFVSSLLVQWLRLCFQCRGYGFNPWWGN